LGDPEGELGEEKKGVGSKRNPGESVNGAIYTSLEYRSRKNDPFIPARVESPLYLSVSPFL
jgi:hypothetical protein